MDCELGTFPGLSPHLLQYFSSKRSRGLFFVLCVVRISFNSCRNSACFQISFFFDVVHGVSALIDGGVAIFFD